MFTFNSKSDSSSLFRLALPAIVCVAMPAASVFAQVDDAAKKLMTESAEAIKALRGVTFTVSASTEGAGGLKLGGTGTITYLRPATIAHTPGAATAINLATPSFMADAQTEVAVDGKLKFLVSLIDNQTVTHIDEKEKIVFQRPMAPKTDGDKYVNRVRTVLFPPPLTDAEPFEKEQRATNISVDEPKMVDGEACDVVKVVTDNKSEHTIAISQKDRLPRMYQISRPIGKDQSLVRRWEITKVKVDPKLTVKDLEIKTPDGFKFVKEEPKPVEVAPSAAAPAVKPAAAPAAGGLAVGTVAPAFELKLAGGGDLKSADLAGTVTVLGFWSPMIPASNEMAKNMQGLVGKVDGKAVKVFAIACREGSDEEPRVQKLIADSKASFRSAINGDEAAKSFGVRGFPSIAVLGKDGKVAAFFENIPTVDALKSAVDAAGK